jgi:predicted Rossmann-fold nucleotide-binding protein
MLTDFKPDLVVAFPGGKGTADMIAKARRKKIEVREFAPNN